MSRLIEINHFLFVTYNRMQFIDEDNLVPGKVYTMTVPEEKRLRIPKHKEFYGEYYGIIEIGRDRFRSFERPERPIAAQVGRQYTASRLFPMGHFRQFDIKIEQGNTKEANAMIRKKSAEMRKPRLLGEEYTPNTGGLSIQEELMQRAWHPNRLQRLLNQGYSLENVGNEFAPAVEGVGRGNKKGGRKTRKTRRVINKKNRKI